MKHLSRSYIIIPIVTITILIIYALLVYWILPTYVHPDKVQSSISATQLALTIATTLTGLGIYVAKYLDFKESLTK